MLVEMLLKAGDQPNCRARAAPAPIERERAEQARTLDAHASAIVQLREELQALRDQRR